MYTEDVEIEKKRLHHEFSDCLAVINTCLRDYYSGDTHMYKAMAGQLRILFCDKGQENKKLLIDDVFKNFNLNRVQPIEWIPPASLPDRTDDLRHLRINVPAEQDIQIAKMPFVIRKYGNGLEIADIEMDKSGQLLSMTDWVNQQVTIYPDKLSIRDIIRTVADRGGGSHIHRSLDPKLNLMISHRAAGLGVHILFIVALARFAQNIGVHYAQFRKQCGYRGSTSEFTFDPEDETVKQMAQVPEDIQLSGGSEYHLTVVKRFT